MLPNGPKEHDSSSHRDRKRPIYPELLRNSPVLWLDIAAWGEVEEACAENCLEIVSCVNLGGDWLQFTHTDVRSW